MIFNNYQNLENNYQNLKTELFRKIIGGFSINWKPITSISEMYVVLSIFLFL